MGDISKKAIDLELLNYYDSKMKSWTVGSILDMTSLLEADELNSDFYVYNLDDGEYKTSHPINCHFDSANTAVLDGILSTVNISSSNNLKYYVLRDIKNDGRIVFYYGYTDKTTKTGKNGVFDFQSILADILQLKNDIVIDNNSITSDKLANESVTIGKLSDEVKSSFDASGSADAALESAKTYTDNAFSWGKI